MPTYLITNRVPEDLTGSPEVFAAFTAWFENLGPSLEDRGNPAFIRAAVGNCGAGTVLGGYTLITADGLEAAVALAGGHPLITRGGGTRSPGAQKPGNTCRSWSRSARLVSTGGVCAGSRRP
jgi:hypothetical protein